MSIGKSFYQAGKHYIISHRYNKKLFVTFLVLGINLTTYTLSFIYMLTKIDLYVTEPQSIYDIKQLIQ